VWCKGTPQARPSRHRRKPLPNEEVLPVAALCHHRAVRRAGTGQRPLSSQWRWWWSEARAERALELYDEDAAADHTGAGCTGAGRSSNYHHTSLYRKLNCDLYDDAGDYTVRV